MTLAGGVRPSGAGGLFSFSGQIPDRVALNSAPEPALCSSFVLTRAAARAMAQIDAALAERCGKFFWIGAAAGTGKTHFLNYLLGLETRARLDQTHRGTRYRIRG